MLRLSRKDAVSARRLRDARARRVLITVLTIAFATFISVANATAEDIAAADAPQPSSPEIVVAAPVEEAAPAPAVEPAPAPEPAPVVEAAPAPEAAAPAAEPVVEPTVEPAVVVDNAVEELAAPAEDSVKEAAAAPEPKVVGLVKAPALKCKGNGVCRVSGGAGAWTLADDDSVKVCHATNGEASLGNGFNFITPNSDSIYLGASDQSNDHGNHPKSNFWTTSYTVNDIVESFSYFTGDANGNGVVDDAEVRTYAGSNLTSIAYPAGVSWASIYGSAAGTTGQQILDAGCGAPAPYTPPTTPVCPTPLVNFAAAGAPLDCRPVKPTIKPIEVEVCHANGNSDTWNADLWTVNGSVATGHGPDLNDVIPAFTYELDYTWDGSKWVVVTKDFLGRNLTSLVPIKITVLGGANITLNILGETLLATSCAGETAPPKPKTIRHSPVTICHANNGSGSDFYNLITVDDDAILPLGTGHDGHEYDIIPSFQYVAGWKWDPAVAPSGAWVEDVKTYAGKNLTTFTRTVHFPHTGNVTLTIDGAAVAAAIVNQTATATDCGPAPRPAKPPVADRTVEVCHATTLAGFDTYVKQDWTIVGGNVAAGHGLDTNDVIPAFTDIIVDYTFDADPTVFDWVPVYASPRDFAGQNLGSFTRTMSLPLIGSITRTLDGTKMLASGCQVPSLPVRPDIQPVTVTLCHAYSLDGIDRYSNVSTGHTGVLGATGHDADASDVIPPFTYTTGFTYDHVTNSWIAQTASYAGKNLGSFTRTVNLASGPATLTFDGTAMLAAGTCPTPTVPTTADTPAPTPNPVVPGGGDEPDDADADADPVDPAVEAEADEPADEPAEEPAAAEDDNALPFTGLELGALLLIGFGAIGAGTVLHGGRRRRRAAKD